MPRFKFKQFMNIWGGGTVKSCFFLKDSDNIITPSNEVGVTRNTIARKQSVHKNDYLLWSIQEIMTTTKLAILQQED